MGKTFEVVSDLPTYPAWWPEVKKVDLVDADRANVTITALIPYSLKFLMERELDDPAGGVLRARLTGDLQGWSSWKLREQMGGCTLVFEEEVEAKKRLLRLLAPVARPAFQLNHSIMMKRGEAGLRRYLASR